MDRKRLDMKTEKTGTELTVGLSPADRRPARRAGYRVRLIDDLGRMVIPKEIRRTRRIREWDPLLTRLTVKERAVFYIGTMEKKLNKI